ncbi:MAG TPA: ectonucleotide pyrophosphatase/phosphodiesterase [Bacteroidales bacterium]
MTIKFASFLLFLALSYQFCFSQAKDDKPYLVVLSMDGFRWDYPDSFPTPNLHRMANQGIKARSIIPSFPTVTFPNHYTLATGLYPDHHGIVHNNFYDPALLLTYKLGDRETVEDGRFYGGEPIWITAEKQHMKSASFYWVGSEASGIHPTYWKAYDKRITFEQRIDTVIHWLSLPEALRPHLIMFYFDQPDHVGHSKGPFATETRSMVMYLDSLVGVFMGKVRKLPVGKEVNFIATSDHGMSYVTDKKEIIIDSYIHPDWFAHVNGGNPVYFIDPKPDYADSIIRKLSGIPHLSVWRKNEVPQRLHFGTNPRIGQLVLLADSSYSISLRRYKMEEEGAHGYDNRNTDMHAIFYAMGPAFKIDYSAPSFPNVDLYSLMAYILGLDPAKTDGNLDDVRGMLK